MRKETAISLTLVMAFIAGFVVLILSLPWLGTLRTPQPLTSAQRPLAATQVAPARPSGQAIALTCARMASVDMTSGVPITLAQTQEMEQCAHRMMALLR